MQEKAKGEKAKEEGLMRLSAFLPTEDLSNRPLTPIMLNTEAVPLIVISDFRMSGKVSFNRAVACHAICRRSHDNCRDLKTL